MTRVYVPNLEHIPYAVRPFAGWPSALPAPRQQYQSQQAATPQQYIDSEEAKEDYDKDWQDYVLDYTDPHEINSLVDIIFNESALNKKYKRLDDKPGFDLADIKQRVTAGVDLVKRAYVRPVQELGMQGFAAAGLNMLQQLETMDILANPVKGALIEGFKNNSFSAAWDGFKKGLGTTEAGRTQYDFDVMPDTNGDWALNMALEVVADPFTWLTAGVGAAKSVVAKPLAKGITQALDDVAQELGEQAVKTLDPKVLDTIAKSVTEALKNQDVPVAEAVRRGINAAKLPVNEVTDTFAYRYAAKISEKVQQNLADSTALRVLSGLDKLGKGVDKVESLLMWASAPILPLAWHGMRPLLSNTTAYVVRQMNDVLKSKAIVNPEGYVSLTRMDLAQEIIAERGRDMLKSGLVPEDLGEALSMALYMTTHNKDVQTVRELYKKFYKDRVRLIQELDLHFKTIAGVNFEQYVKATKEFAEKYPQYKYYATQFEAEYLRLDLLLNGNRRPKEYLSALKQAKDKAISDSAINFEDMAQQELDYIPKPSTPELEDMLALFSKDIKAATDVAKEALKYNTPFTAGVRFKKTWREVVGVDNADATWDQVPRQYATVDVGQDAAGDLRTLAPEHVLERLGQLKAFVDGVRSQSMADTTLSIQDILATNRYVQELLQFDAFSDFHGLNYSITDFIDIRVDLLPADKASTFVAYKIKESNASLAMDLLELPGLQNILEDIRVNGQMAKVLDDVAPRFRTALHDLLMLTVQGQQDYQVLLEQLYASSELKTYFVNLFDTLQTFKNWELNNVVSERGEFIDEVIEKLQIQLTSVSQRQRYKLEKLLGEDKIKELTARYGLPEGKAHTAWFDAVMAEELFKPGNRLADYAGKLTENDTVPIFFDIESFGLKGGKYPMLQLHYKYGDEIRQLDCRLDEMMLPDEALLKTLDMTPEQFVNHYSNSALPTEKEVLQQFIKHLQEIEATTGKRVRLVGQNIDGFDHEFLLKRMRRTGVDFKDYRYLHTIQRLDSLKLLYQIDGLPQLSLTATDELRQILDTYLTMRIQAPLTMGMDQHFIDTMDFEKLTTISQMQKETRMDGTFRNVPPHKSTDISKDSAELWHEAYAAQQQQQHLLDSFIKGNPDKANGTRQDLLNFKNKSQYAHPGYWKGTHDYQGNPLTDIIPAELTTKNLLEMFPFLPSKVRKHLSELFPDLIKHPDAPPTRPIDEILSIDNIAGVKRLLEHVSDKETLTELYMLEARAQHIDPMMVKDLNAYNSLDQLQDSVFSLYSQRTLEKKRLSKIKLYYDTESGAFFDAHMRQMNNPNGSVHVMQLFANQPGQMYVHGVKKTFAADQVPRFFELSETDRLNPLILEHYYNRFKSIEKAGHIVSDLQIIQPYHADYPEIVERLIRATRQLYGERGIPFPEQMFASLKTPVGTLDRYSVARWVHMHNNKFASNNGMTNYYSKILKDYTGGIMLNGNFSHSQKAYQTVVNPEYFGMRWGGIHKTDAEIASAFHSPTLVSGGIWERGNAWLNEIPEMRSQIEDQLTALALARDINDISSASAQAAYSVLADTREVWDDIYDYIVHLPEDQAVRTKILLEAKVLSEVNTDGKALAELLRLGKTAAQDLADETWLYRFGSFSFGIGESSAEDSALQQTFVNAFLRRKDELAKVGLNVHFDELDQRLWVHVDYTDPDVVTKFVAREKYLRESGEINRLRNQVFVEQTSLYKQTETEMSAMLQLQADKLARQLATNTGNRSVGTLGDVFEKRQLETLYAHAPEEIRNRLVPMKVWIEDLARFKSMQFNRSNIGTVASRKVLEPYVSRNILKNYTMAMQWLANRMEDQIKYRYMFFDELWRLDGPQYMDLSDQELLDILKHNRALKGARLVRSDKKGMRGMRMVEFNIRTAADIKQAKELGVVLLPPQTFLEAWRGINELDQPPAFFKYMNRYIIQPMKLGYITSVGMLLRNTVDSTAKNYTLTKGPHQAAPMSMHMLETWRHYNDYKSIFHAVVWHKDNPRPVMSLRVLNKLYDESPQPMSKEMFLFYHNYLEQGATASISAAQKAEIMKDADAWSKYVLNNIGTRYILDLNSEVENLVRLTAYTWEIMHGATIDEAMAAVLRTHFDYSVKSRAKMYADYLIPFFGFMEQNLMLWLRLLSEKGWAAGMFQNLMTPIWDLDRYDHQEINQNRSIQYNVLAGNIVLDSGLVLKLNPSVMDALRILSDPNEAVGRVNSLGRAAYSYIQDPEQDVTKLIASNLPMVGPTLSRYWLSDDPVVQGSAWRAAQRVDEPFNNAPLLAPSVFGGALRLYYFAYPTGDVYSTANKDKLMEHLEAGAVQVITPEDAIQITATEETRGRYFFAFPGSAVYATSNPDKLTEMLAKGAQPITLTEDLAHEVLVAMRAAMAAKAAGWVKPSTSRTRRSYPSNKKIKPVKFKTTKVKLPYDANHRMYRFGPVVFNKVMTTARGRQQRMLRPNTKGRSIPRVQPFKTKGQAIKRLKQDWAYLR